YAVKHVKVSHVVVAGHTGCGGCAAALGDFNDGVIGRWLGPLKELKEANKEVLRGLAERDNAEAMAKLAELNVLRGVDVLQQKSVVADGVKDGSLKVHGVVYDLGSGCLREIY
ncbi:hypothetical protein LTR66_003868, partial [Elasticomyces elasticus]